ncbi:MULTISPECIES: DUF1707 domain-containing protein [unclassified Brevibacterium]|uniref:DUF1707 SHOCT-like domain-containing protein n=1 Tax=unclassified Brevibacterium TaxID=2614124 RepID=UPI001E4E09D5|nr:MULTISPECIES: DUF1707 domain-containing protein [unclassified Brevibacterium]MCD1285592.1 hypothetical protein [Brevibacterium sp. CCUG 69071]MDK8434647.1 DUF1707 domain-containing protein [Brevibacterium sp. H-BE7]
MTPTGSDEPIGQPEDPARTMRIGHPECDAAIETLRKAAGEGRISLDELEERMERVESARFPIDLDEALADVTPDRPSAHARAEADGIRADDLASRRSGAGWSTENREIVHAPWTTGLIRNGRWPVPAYLRCEPAGVLLELNFLEVSTDLKIIDIEVAARTGTLKLVVPDDWGVDIADLQRRSIAVIAFKANQAAEEGSPTIRVHGSIGAGVLQVLLPNRRQRRKLSS